jgi:hypothetical protein
MAGMTSQDIAVAIDRPAAEVAGYAREPGNLPAWAAGLAAGIEEADGRWFASSPMGQVEVRFTSDEPGVLDHDVVLPTGEVVHNPLRVLDDGDGCRVVFTLHRRPGMTDEEYADDAAAVAADLSRLRRTLEGRR